MSLTVFLPTFRLEELYDGETPDVRVELFNRYRTEYEHCPEEELCQILVETFETHDWVIPPETIDDVLRAAIMTILEGRGGAPFRVFLGDLGDRNACQDDPEDNKAFIRLFTGWFYPGQLFGPGIVP